jgi:hypothetical protein
MDGMAAHWDRLCENRSTALNHRRRTEAPVGNVLWLPTAAKIRDELRLTYARRAAINALFPDRQPIRGVGVLDPLTKEEKREYDRLRKEAARRAGGVQPQASRTKTAQREALAAEIACSARTLERHEKKGTLVAFLAGRGIDVENASARYSYLLDMPGQVFDTSQDKAGEHVEAMAIFREIAFDPYARTLDEELVLT